MTEETLPTPTEQPVEKSDDEKKDAKKCRRGFTFGVNFFVIIFAWSALEFITKEVPKVSTPNIPIAILAFIAIALVLYIIGSAIYECLEIVVEMICEKAAEAFSNRK